jgi:hypothetical protein
MSLSYDLHTHSIASDGTLTPTELIRQAKTQGVHVLALTDHDTLDGIAEAQGAAKACGLELVTGVEISATWGKAVDIHIVGLNVRTDYEPLNTGLASLKEFRDWRAQEIGKRLEKKAGICGAFEGARAYAKGGLVSRTHFARFLVEEGHAKGMQDAFVKYLKRSKPGYVPGQWAPMEQALAWIHGAGGQAVIAHPARYPLSATKLRLLLGEFKECEGSAIEVISGSHSRDNYFQMANLANKFGLLASAGSDYHGPENPWIELGRLPALPDGCVPVWHDWEIPVRNTG